MSATSHGERGRVYFPSEFASAQLFRKNYMFKTASKIPPGMRYHSGTEAHLRRTIIDTVIGVFDGWSYDEITTPSIDYYSLFERGMGRNEAERAFRFTDTDGHLLTLRPDVTSAVARAAATLLAKSERPLRLSYAANVFRQRPRSRTEWRRESLQLGCELIGSAGAEADMEVLAIAVEVLERLGLQGAYRITLNSVEIFNGVIEQLKFDAAACDHMRNLIITRDSAGLQSFLLHHAPSFAGHTLFSRHTQFSDKRETLSEARRMTTNRRSIAALNSLEWLRSIIESLGLSESFEIDFGDVSRLDYYTGLTFKIYVAGIGTLVGSGGRYDELTANFGRPEPSVGFVLDLDSLVEALTLKNTAFTKTLNRNPVQIEADNTAALFSEARQRRSNDERIRIGSSIGYLS
jgi:ATP phosphoribosyltransferase regulatory subunit